MQAAPPYRVHAIEPEWLRRMRTTTVYAYRMPEEPFDVVADDRISIASTTVDALERVELGDLLRLHADARIELRAAPRLLAFWGRVIATTLEYSGIRLRNAAPV